MVDVGLALPTMASGWRRGTWTTWCEVVDEGPFASLSTGERITFHNPEALTALAAAAALTERARIMTNVIVAPWHATTLLAKQLATIDVISDGRLDVGLGVGARSQDFASMGASTRHRHQRLDEQAAELRRLWSGEPALEGAPPLGPPTVQLGGPPLYAGALGPKAIARAAAWATGTSGFSLNLDTTEVAGAVGQARAAWQAAGRSSPPRVVTACFYALGTAASDVLAEFTRAYFAVFGAEVADLMASQVSLTSHDALAEALGAVAATGIDEVILVPASVDPAQAGAAAEVAAAVVG